MLLLQLPCLAEVKRVRALLGYQGLVLIHSLPCRGQAAERALLHRAPRGLRWTKRVCTRSLRLLTLSPRLPLELPGYLRISQ